MSLRRCALSKGPVRSLKRERRQKQLSKAAILPLDVEIGNESVDEDQVKGSVCDHMMGNMASPLRHSG